MVQRSQSYRHWDFIRYGALIDHVDHWLPHISHIATRLQCRAWANKPVEVKVLLLALLSTEATHPKVAEMVRACGFFNFTGRAGSYVNIDRAVEFINLLQDERRGKFSTFDKSLEFTDSLAGGLSLLPRMPRINTCPPLTLCAEAQA